MIGRRYPKAGKTLGEGLGRGVLRITLGWTKFICCLHVQSTSEAPCFMERVNVSLKPPRGQAKCLFRCWLPESSLLFLGWTTGSLRNFPATWDPSESQESTLLVTVEEKDHRCDRGSGNSRLHYPEGSTGRGG